MVESFPIYFSFTISIGAIYFGISLPLSIFTSFDAIFSLLRDFVSTPAGGRQESDNGMISKFMWNCEIISAKTTTFFWFETKKNKKQSNNPYRFNSIACTARKPQIRPTWRCRAECLCAMHTSPFRHFMFLLTDESASKCTRWLRKVQRDEPNEEENWMWPTGGITCEMPK